MEHKTSFEVPEALTFDDIISSAQLLGSFAA